MPYGQFGLLTKHIATVQFAEDTTSFTVVLKSVLTQKIDVSLFSAKVFFFFLPLISEWLPFAANL